MQVQGRCVMLNWFLGRQFQDLLHQRNYLNWGKISYSVNWEEYPVLPILVPVKNYRKGKGIWRSRRLKDILKKDDSGCFKMTSQKLCDNRNIPACQSFSLSDALGHSVTICLLVSLHWCCSHSFAQTRLQVLRRLRVTRHCEMKAVPLYFNVCQHLLYGGTQP